MSDRPILFSAPMIRAILAGRKTQTRRLAWITPKRARDSFLCDPKDRLDKPSAWQRVERGDKLWVREACIIGKAVGGYAAGVDPDRDPSGETVDIIYRADSGGDSGAGPWRPSIHMPRWASRITLAVTVVKIERLQDISYDDCSAEGVICRIHGDVRHTACTGLRSAFCAVWTEIHGLGAWDSNPYVVAVSFERVP